MCEQKYECPICKESVIISGNELICENLDCTFDKTIIDLVEYYCENRLEKIYEVD